MVLDIKWQRQKILIRMVNVIPVRNICYAEAKLLCLLCGHITNTF